MPKFLPKKARSGVLAAVALAVLLCGRTNAPAAGADDAATRAALYQAEARRIFEKDHWGIIRKDSRGFTAVHRALENGGSSQDPTVPPMMVHVSVAFNPHSADRTDCAVKIESFQIVPRRDGKKPRVVGPFKADYPENTKYIQDALARAEDELGKKYPKYQAN